MMSSAIIEVKKQEVNEATKRFQDSVSCVVVDYRGLTVKEVTELRNKLRAEGAELKVLKNNISRRAATEAGYEKLADVFTGPSAVVFSENDAVAPARIVYEFAKTHEKLELKGGYVERKLVNVEQLAEVAKLPNREGMLSMLLSVLQAPVRNFAYAVKAISEKDAEVVTE
jgi:large subunit ribosomal protein L10